MDIKVILNWVKWQIKHRMPGGDLFKCAMNNCSDNKELEYYLFMHDLYGDLFSRYIKGLYLTGNDDQKDFYKYMDSYRKNEKDYYTFEMKNQEKFNIPIPSMDDRKIYRTELNDLVLPYFYNYPTNNRAPFHEGPYEYNNVRLRNGDVVFDLGANFGIFSAFASSKKCEVHAFEPTIETVKKYLTKTASLNPNINIVTKAVSDKNGYQEFTIDKKDSRCNGISKTKTNLLGHDEGKLLIPTTTIDSYVNEKNLSRVNFIKADIEGAERLMLKGARETLKYFEPDLAICYYHLYDDYKVLTDLIKEANPNYVIEHKWQKIYAHTKKKR